jgi:F-type H+-transporting ATPase subunit b
MLRFHLSTLIFQLLNFFILLAALTWFLYRPLLRVMRRREEEISTRLREAEELTRKAEQERQELADERRRVQGEAETLVARAREDASRQRTEVLEEARRQAAKYLEEAQRRGEEQGRGARQLLEAEARRTAVALATALLERMPVGALHEALVAQLLDQGLEGDGEQGALLHRALASAGSTVAVELALPASPEVEARVRRRLTEVWGKTGDDLAAVFRVQPSLIAGLRILIGTVVLELSLGGILAQLEHESEIEGARS